MKKYLIIFNVFCLLIASTLTIACTKETTLYASQGKIADPNLDFWSNQTASIVKALVISKEKKADTCQTIKDILTKLNNKDTENINMNLKSWKEFSQVWGFKHKINTSNNFNPEEYFVADGTGEFTKKLKVYKSWTKIYPELFFILDKNTISNKLLYDLLFKDEDTKNLLLNFLNQIQKINLDNESKEKLNPFLKTIKMLVLGVPKENGAKHQTDDEKRKNFTETINALKSLFNYLIKNQWSEEQKTTPKNKAEFENFMNNWQDEEGNNISIPSSYSISNLFGSSHSEKNWKENEYNLYRGFFLINYLFFKIGKDHKIQKPKNIIKEGNKNKKSQDSSYKDRYLKDIINDHRKLHGYSIMINSEEFFKDIKQYFPYLSENPKYMFTLIEGLLPIIKQEILPKNLNEGISSLNFDTLTICLKKIQEILNEPKKIIEIIKNLLKNKILKAIIPHSGTLQLANKLLFFNNSFMKNILKAILGMCGIEEDNNGNFTWKEEQKEKIDKINKKILQQLLNNLEKNQDEINLKKIQKLLLDKNEGILWKFNEQIIPTLYDIFTSQKINLNDYIKLLQNLGIQMPEKDKKPPQEVKDNSFLELIAQLLAKTPPIKNEKDIQTLAFLSKLYFWVTQKVNSLSTDSDYWIKIYYKTIFDVKNQTNSTISNIKINTVQVKNKTLDTLSYNLKYQIEEKTYNFFIKCQSDDNLALSNKTKSFYFTEIKLISLK